MKIKSVLDPKTGVTKTVTEKNYNRIVIIGNGFDRAAGLKSSYQNFIDNYFRNIINEILEHPHKFSYEFPLCSITFKPEDHNFFRNGYKKKK
jgi:hypothetical protein